MWESYLIKLYCCISARGQRLRAGMRCMSSADFVRTSCSNLEATRFQNLSLFSACSEQS